jgi:hypothetical protein
MYGEMLRIEAFRSEDVSRQRLSRIEHGICDRASGSRWSMRDAPLSA